MAAAGISSGGRGTGRPRKSVPLKMATLPEDASIGPRQWKIEIASEVVQLGVETATKSVGGDQTGRGNPLDQAVDDSRNVVIHLPASFAGSERAIVNRRQQSEQRRNLRFRPREVSIEGMISRRLWKCPQCGRRWEIPAGSDPQCCPKCVPAAAESQSADSGERGVRSFFAAFVVEDATGARRPPKRTVRDAKQAASEPAFFVPLPTESNVLDATLAEEPDVFRKRKQRSRVPLVAVVACVAGCVLMVGLIVYQKTKGLTSAAIAVKAAVQGQPKRAGAAGSPIVAGTRDGRTESPAAQAQKTQLGAENARGRKLCPKRQR